MNLNSGPKNNPPYQIWAWSSNCLKNNSSFFFVFSMAKMMWHTVNKRLLWQPLMRMVIDKICKMTIKSVKSKSESFLQYLMAFWSYGGKTLGGRILPPPPLPAWIGLRVIVRKTCLCLVYSLLYSSHIFKLVLESILFRVMLIIA